MTTAQPDSGAINGNEKPVFHALLMPHRSLGRKGFTVLMLVMVGLCAVPMMLFTALGAWPITGFLGLDILALYVAFKLNFRAAREREEVTVSRTELAILKTSPKGKTSEHRFNTIWARFNVDRHPEIGVTRMEVTGQGRKVGLGAFLNPDDRETFATAFAGALAQAKR